jgi:hypothetical protein
LTKPGSTTKVIQSIVIEVSAIFVASTTFRLPFGAGSKIRDCNSDGRALKRLVIVHSRVRLEYETYQSRLVG